MGHSASEMGYKTPNERHLWEIQHYRDMKNAYANHTYTPYIGDTVELTDEGWYSLGILVYMWPWKKVERIKVERSKTFISFETEEETKRRLGNNSFTESIARITGLTEWYDAKHFQKVEQ